MKIPIVDSLAHPTLNGTWMNQPARAGFDTLVADMEAANVAAACAVGMWGMDGYQHEAFMTACLAHPQLIPIAGYKPGETCQVVADLDRIKAMGYCGIKLHPRFSGIDIASPILGDVFAAASEKDLVVFYCTYQHARLEQWPGVDPLMALVTMLKAAPRARVVLVHGGDIELLRHMQLVRFNENLLLDLSHTILKYPSSSIDLDIGFLFREFDRRICVGSDWPQFTCSALRARFEHFAAGIDEERVHNIASHNLLRFLGVDSFPGGAPAASRKG